jgi:hypothetical protein
MPFYCQHFWRWQFSGSGGNRRSESVSALDICDFAAIAETAALCPRDGYGHEFSAVCSNVFADRRRAGWIDERADV